jgi:hypothetical protein
MKYLLFLLCLLELLLVSYCKNVAGPFVSPVIFFLVSVGIGFVYLKRAQIEDSPQPVRHYSNNFVFKLIQIVLFIGLSVFIFISLRAAFQTYKISMNGVERSDVIPQIMYLVKRFKSGQQPYYTIPFPWKLFPTYLPFQWLPYLLAEWANKDYRWVPAIAFELSCAYFFIRSLLAKGADDETPLKIVSGVWPLIIWAVLLRYDQGMFVVTVETLVAAYYLLVCTSIFDKRVYMLAIGISLCLLSRYSIVFWMPVCVACYYIDGQKKAAVTIVSVILLFFILFYWVPFLRLDPYIFWKGYQYHSEAALFDWTYARCLFNGLGFSSFAVRYLPGDVGHKLHIYQAIHLFACISTAVLCVIFYAKNKSKYSLQQFLLFSLKIYLTVFYLFIQTPYDYIYIVPLVISAALLSGVIVQNNSNKY